MTAASSTFSVGEMLAAASAESGLDDFGDGEFREALARLVESTNEEDNLSPMGAMAFKADVHRILVNRLRFAADLERHPEILDEDVSDPIVVLGMPRTGTTKLQRMLAADPDVQRLEYWRTFNPAPFANTAPGQPDPRIAACAQAVAMMAQLMPGWTESHPTGAEDVDEDVFLQLFTFKCVFNYMARPVPAYKRWFDTQSLAGTYRYEKQLLQYLQWQDGGKRGRPWVLKSPAHLGTTDLLRETFPRATLVCTHRDLQQVIPSHCRLQESSWRFFCKAPDMRALGRAVLEEFPGELRKHLALRDRIGARLDILDVQYDEIRNDPLAVIREVYRRAGRELTPAREAAMLAWEASHPGHAGGQGYTLADYGLTPQAVDAACHDYTARFVR